MLKRNMDLIREILLKLEQKDNDFVGPLEIEGYEQKDISYQIGLLHDAGLISDLDDLTHMGSQGKEYWPDRLTWEGHEFLEASRDKNRWDQAKQTMVEKSGGIAFSVFRQLLLELTKRAVFGT